MTDKKKEKPYALSDTSKYGDLEKAIDNYHSDTHQDKLNDYQLNVIDAQQKLYQTFKSGIDGLGGNDAKLSGKEKELKSSAVKALESYFEVVDNKVLDTIKEMKKSGELKEEDAYEILMDAYDSHVAGPGNSSGLRELIKESYGSTNEEGDSYKGRDILLMMNEIAKKHSEDAVQVRKATAFNHHLGSYQKHELVGALLKKAGKTHEIKDPMLLYKQDGIKIVDMYKGVNEGKEFPKHKLKKKKE
jgi:hypothetical protein